MSATGGRSKLGALPRLYFAAGGVAVASTLVSLDPVLCLMAVLPAAALLFYIPAVPGVFAASVTAFKVLSDYDFASQITDKLYVKTVAKGIRVFLVALLVSVIALEVFTILKGGISSENGFNNTTLLPAGLILVSLPLIEGGKLVNIPRTAVRVAGTVLSVVNGLMRFLNGTAEFASGTFGGKPQAFIGAAATIAVAAVILVKVLNSRARLSARQIVASNMAA